MSLITAIALYAAIISTGGLAWAIYVWIRDRYKLVTSLQVQEIWTPESRSPNTREIVFRIINQGRQPGTIVDLGFELDKSIVSGTEDKPIYYRESATNGGSTPFVLQPGNWHESRLPIVVCEVGRIRWWAKDSNGRTY